MFKRLIATAVGSLFCLNAYAAQKEIILATNLSYPPYIIVHKGKRSTGIMMDAYYRIMDNLGYQIKHKPIPRKRIEFTMAEGKIDNAPMSPAFTKGAERFLFSEPIVMIRDVIFSRKEDPVHYKGPDSLLGKVVGTHLGYGYPPLEPYFKDNRIRREDSKSEKTILQMVNRSRVNVGVLNDFVGAWIIKENNWKDQFVVCGEVEAEFPYEFMFRKELAADMAAFNAELAKLKASGELQKIINSYLPQARMDYQADTCTSIG